MSVCNVIIHRVPLTQNGSPCAKYSQLRSFLSGSHTAFHAFKKLVAKQPEYPSMDEWINKMLNTYIMEYYLALKKREILTHATTCLNLEDIVPSKINQLQKDGYCTIPFI